VREVPDGASSCDDELEAADQKGVDPESTKQMIEEHISSLVVPDDCSDKLKRGFARLDVTNGHDPDSEEGPSYDPRTAKNKEDNR
jgi:hypothetical protein